MRTPNANDHRMPLNETPLDENFLRAPLIAVQDWKDVLIYT